MARIRYSNFKLRIVIWSNFFWRFEKQIALSEKKPPLVKYLKMLNSNFRYHQWHLWLLGLSLLPAMAMGIIAALFVEHRVEPNGRFGVPQPSRPGCFVPADPFKVN